MEDFDFNDTAPAPLSEQEFLMENLCVKKGRAPGGYEPPATRSAAKRWKNVHEQSMMLRLNEMHIIKKQNAQMSKEAAREIIRKIPVELLAKEWLSKEDATVDMRAYLVDHILPTLILGVERLLKEVEEKGLSATNRFEPEFNPINFLAQYLMRNNPRFSNFAEASPYVRGLREVSEEIKQELFTFEDNRLARIKAETRRKRTDRERHEQQIQEEKDRRQAQLISHFKEWIGNTEETTVELSLLQNALRAFTETVEQLPPDTQEVAKFGQPLEPTDETGKTLAVKDFAKYISLFVEDLPFEIFQLFMVHMSKCAAAHKASADRDNRKTILTNLFLICDYGVVRFMNADRTLGLLDRARILTLCEMFWDSLMDAKDPVGTLRNPRRWPIVEVNEVDDILFDAWHEEPDGGVTPKEARIQEKQFLAIKNALDQEVEIIAAKDKIAKKKWKEEQLLQKSEGYRMKLYKYNVTDFMSLVHYPFLDTLEAPKGNLNLTEEKLSQDHDLYANTITKTVRERSRKTDLKAQEEEKDDTKDEEENLKEHPDENVNLNANKDKNLNSNMRCQHSKSDEESLSKEPANRNNNMDERGKRYTEESEERHQKTTKKAGLKQKKSKRSVWFNSTSDESSEETESIGMSWPGIKKGPFSSSGVIKGHKIEVRSLPKIEQKKIDPYSLPEIARCRKGIGSLKMPPSSLNKGIQSTMGSSVRRVNSPTVLPPISKSRQPLPVGRQTLKKQKTLGRDTVNGDTVAGIETAEGDNTVNGDTVAGIETAEGDNTVNGDTVVGDETIEQEDVTEEIDMITNENAGKKPEETINVDDNDHTPADAPAEDEEVREATAREEIKEDAAKSVGEDTTDLAAEATANEDAEGTADEHAGKSEELFQSEESQQIPAEDEQKRESATEEKADTEEIIKTNEEIKEKDEDCRELSDFATSDETGNANRICSDTTVGEHPAGDFKGQGEAEKEVTAQVVGDETAVREQAAEADILKDLAAEQAKILASRSRRSSVNTVTESEPLDIRSAMISDYFAKLQEDINFNRNFQDVNINSCFRARQMSTTSLQRESVTMSAFNENYLNLAQFVQLMETFIGHHPDSSVFATLVHYLTDNYQDTESEKTDRLLDARNAATQAKRKATLNNLFEKWDNDASGFLDLDNVVDVMCKFKEGQEVEVIRLAQSNLKKQSTYHDQRLSKSEFRQFIKLVVDEIPGPETFDILVEFLVNSVERSYAERIRGEARKKWLEQIIIVAQTTGTSMEPVYKAVFQALYRDAETHGDEKRISASIAMLEVNKLAKSRGPLLLRYAACTPEDCQYMLGKPLYKNMKGVSFQAVETGRPIHVPRVANHGSVYFWNYDRRPEKRSGSFVVVPIKDKQKRVFGVLGVDTMIDPNESTIFVTHEVHFFQGVAKAFSIAYHLVEKRRKFLRAMESAVLWMSRHCPHIVDITVYFVEPNTRVPGDYILRKVMIKDKQGDAVNISEVIRLERKDSLFRNYLFECMETSETVTAELDGARHIASPLRDDAGVTVGIVDLSLGELKNLPRYESKEAQRMLRLLQRAHKELTKISMGDEPDCVLEIESDVIARVEILYERLMLQELRDNIDRIDPASFSEITTYYEPPRVIAEVLRATLAVLKVDQVGEGEYDDWDDLKNCISTEFMQQIIAYDPTAAANPDSEKVEKYLRDVPFAEIARQGNILAQQLYNWVFVCLSLIEYTRKMKENIENNMLEAAEDEIKEPTFTVV